MNETRAFERETHVVEDAKKMAAWAEENADENELPPPEEDEKERQRMQLLESDRNPFHPDIWEKIQDAPMDPEFDFLRNKHLFIPKGYRVKGCHEEADDDKTRVFVLDEKFESVICEAKEYWELKLMWPAPDPPREILESYPYMPILPTRVEIPGAGKEWFWREKLIPK